MAILEKSAYIELKSCNSGSYGNESIASAFARTLGRKTYGYSSPMVFTNINNKQYEGDYVPNDGPLYIIPEMGGQRVEFMP